MRRVSIAGLDVVLAGGSDGEGGGDGPAVVLLHGYGAPGEELVALGRELDAGSSTRFVFPAAPLALESAWGGRAWWLVDILAMQMAIVEGRAHELLDQVPAGIADARAQIEALLDELCAPKVVLGGFSQGAILSLDLALRSERPLAGVVVMSGTLAMTSDWRPLMSRRRGLSLFQSHGTRDPIFPFAIAERLRDELSQAGLAVDWLAFRGQHEIPPPARERLAAFLTQCL
jgi:phospholipase/carboxylesterase